jgi:hypothetical protein
MIKLYHIKTIYYYLNIIEFQLYVFFDSEFCGRKKKIRKHHSKNDCIEMHNIWCSKFYLNAYSNLSQDLVMTSTHVLTLPQLMIIFFLLIRINIVHLSTQKYVALLNRISNLTFTHHNNKKEMLHLNNILAIILQL